MPPTFNYASMMWFRRNMVMRKSKNIFKFISPLTGISIERGGSLGEVKKYWKIMTTPIDRLLSLGRDSADRHAADFKVISNGVIACNSAVDISRWMWYFSLSFIDCSFDRESGKIFNRPLQLELKILYAKGKDFL